MKINEIRYILNELKINFLIIYEQVRNVNIIPIYLEIINFSIASPSIRIK